MKVTKAKVAAAKEDVITISKVASDSLLASRDEAVNIAAKAGKKASKAANQAIKQEKALIKAEVAKATSSTKAFYSRNPEASLLFVAAAAVTVTAAVAVTSAAVGYFSARLK